MLSKSSQLDFFLWILIKSSSLNAVCFPPPPVAWFPACLVLLGRTKALFCVSCHAQLGDTESQPALWDIKMGNIFMVRIITRAAFSFFEASVQTKYLKGSLTAWPFSKINNRTHQGIGHCQLWAFAQVYSSRHESPPVNSALNRIPCQFPQVSGIYVKKEKSEVAGDTQGIYPLDTIGLMLLWTPRDCDSVPKRDTSSSQKKSQHQERKVGTITHC